MLRLKEHKNGKFYAHGTINRERIRKTLDTCDRREAEAKKSKLEHELRSQSDSGKKGSITFDVAAVKYVEDGGEVRFLVPIAAAFKDRDIQKITKSEIRDLARNLYPNAVNSTRNRQVITPAQAVINWAAEEDYCSHIRVKRFPEIKKKASPINREDLDKIRSFCNKYVSAILLFNFQTASRMGNTLQIVEIKIEDRKIEYKTTKNGEPFTVHLSDEMIEILKELTPRNGRVFGYKSKSSVRKAMKKATEKAGLPYRTFHELGRHSFATHFAKLDWNAKKIAEAGGWKTAAMVNDTYTNLRDAGEEARDYFNKIGKNLANKNPKGVQGNENT